MEVLNLKYNTVELNPFKLEKEIQQVIEKKY